MARPLPLLFATLAGFAVASACYAERQGPPTFRYACDSDSDCNETEACREGLCQVECTQLTFAEVCTGQNHLLCFNGVCSTGCDPTDDDPCSKGQDCVDLGLSVSGGGFFGGGSEEMIGVCGSMCTEDSCPAGEVCLEGVCAATCVLTRDCPSGLACFQMFCVPESVVPDEGEASSSLDETTATDGSATAGSGTTGGAT